MIFRLLLTSMLLMQICAEDSFSEESSVVEDSGLSAGAIFGIVIGAIVGVVIIVVVGFLLCFFILPILANMWDLRNGNRTTQ